MYLSRLVLNRAKREVQRDLGSLYELHRTLMRGFPDVAEGGAGRVLFRLEISREDDGEAAVLVQSQHEPGWDGLRTNGYLLAAATKRVRYVTADQNTDANDIVILRSGDMFRFRLVANPTVKKRVDGKKNGRRDACVTEQQQVAWLVRKGESGGFRLLGSAESSGVDERNIMVVPLGRHHSARGNQQEQLCHFGVRFEGLLQVTDARLFMAALESGVGSGKAFGYGLLSIAKV
ncbi:MAG: type I-E CRISPR-associated protein Cas6/Cse3/CasE [Planctomyces sp.]|jgi:CRISPR system Cascade subunit CasE